MPVSTLFQAGITPSRPSSTVRSTRSGVPPQCQIVSVRLGYPVAPCAEDPWQVAQVLLKIDRPSATAVGLAESWSIGRPLYGANVSASFASSAAFSRAYSDADDQPP